MRWSDVFSEYNVPLPIARLEITAMTEIERRGGVNDDGQRQTRRVKVSSYAGDKDAGQTSLVSRSIGRSVVEKKISNTRSYTRKRRERATSRGM